MPVRLSTLVAAAILAGSPWVLRADSPQTVTFLSVAADKDYAEPDGKLKEYLAAPLEHHLESPNPFGTYGDLIQSVINRNDAFIARMTPYAYVAAEMLGARVDVLGTYVSRATATTTYNSYF